MPVWLHGPWGGNIQSLIADEPLYASFTAPLDIRITEQLSALQAHGMRFDGYCPLCKDATTFVMGPYQGAAGFSGSPSPGVLSALRGCLEHMVFTCARVPGHGGLVTIRLEFESPAEGQAVATCRFTKVGQWPSPADLQEGRFRDYRKTIDDIDLAELKSAARLAAHGFGIGSFVYLRRIFERMVERAHQAATLDPGWNEQAYVSAGGMDDRIQLLRFHLPQFVVENRKFYRIVSTGLHELQEEQCIDAFDVVENAVLLMLDEVRAEKLRQQRAKAAAAQLQKISEKLTTKQ